MLALALKVIVPFGIYSVLAGVYARNVIQRMQAVPSPEELLQDIKHETTRFDDDYVVTSIQELRKTISPFTNLVENPRHRLRWNSWAAAAMKDETKPDTTHLSGTYEFAYRSYVNMEEQNGISKALLTWQLGGKRGECSSLHRTIKVNLRR